MARSRAVIFSYLGVAAFASLILLAGGRLTYWQGWLYLGLSVLGTALTHVLAPSGGDRAAYRAQTAAAGESWDRRLLGLSFLVSIVTFVLAGLDAGRFGWSGPVTWEVTAAGSVLLVAGQVVFALARRENSFFAATVQIALDRGHTVCSTGPYALVRHPGYLGLALSTAAVPLVLGSLWALVPTGLALVLLGIRTELEDRYLCQRLEGYQAYAGRVRNKLVPLVY